MHMKTYYVMLLLIGVSLLAGQVSQAQLTGTGVEGCSSTVPVLAQCDQPDSGANSWISRLSAVQLNFTHAELSWISDPDIPPTMQETGYVTFYRMKETENPGKWNRQRLFDDSVFDNSSNMLTYAFDGLMEDTSYEMRVCRALTRSPGPNSSASPACGFCTLCFDTLEATIAVITSSIEVLADGTNRLTCEASGNPLPSIRWDARMSGNRVPLSSNDPAYDITSGINTEDSPTTVNSVLSYDPADVQFVIPECFIDNGLTSTRVLNVDFVTSPTDPTNTLEIPAWLIALLVVLPPIVVVSLVIAIIICKLVYTRRKTRKAALAIVKEITHTKEAEKVATGVKGKLHRTESESNVYNHVPLKSVPGDDGSSVLYDPLYTSLPSHMIIPSTDITVSTVIGQGEFGVVYKGILNRNNHHELVAVKTLKGIFTRASDIQRFIEEILILQHFNHPNVMSLTGVCIEANKASGGPSIILPFMSKGSLLNFLRKEADRLKPAEDDIPLIGAVEKSLAQICLQVARGMEYLSGQKFVHRDLAARNCMIDEYDQIRVGDFGLSEDIYSRNYFRQASSDGVKLPVKWMAPESLKLGIFSEKTDVWSYGVTCWEVFSCGEIPYPGLHPQEVLQMFDSGHRLNKPTNPACSDVMYTVFCSCWETNPDHRKSFTELCAVVETRLTSLSDYLDLNVVANSFKDKSVESPYMIAGDYPADVEEVPQDEDTYNEMADSTEVHDSSSTDELCKVPDDDDGAYMSVTADR